MHAAISDPAELVTLWWVHVPVYTFSLATQQHQMYWASAVSKTVFSNCRAGRLLPGIVLQFTRACLVPCMVCMARKLLLLSSFCHVTIQKKPCKGCIGFCTCILSPQLSIPCLVLQCGGRCLGCLFLEGVLVLALVSVDAACGYHGEARLWHPCMLP